MENPADTRGKSRSGSTPNRRAVWSALAGVLIVTVSIWIGFGSREKPSAPPQLPQAKVPDVVPSSTVVPSPIPSPTAVAESTPTPPVLPASNAFTTLEDYRKRRAAAPRPLEPEALAPAGRTPATELGRVAMSVRDYKAAFGSNPVGLNKEIVRSLLGDNPRGAKFLDPAVATLNAQGELLDTWGRPYFFHAMSGTVMEIRSPGPDGKVFTPDDLVQ